MCAEVVLRKPVQQVLVALKFLQENSNTGSSGCVSGPKIFKVFAGMLMYEQFEHYTFLGIFVASKFFTRSTAQSNQKTF
jgi:hypothetical protein